MPKRSKLPSGWELPPDDERFEVAEQAFEFDHAVRVYGSRWNLDWRWPPWTRPYFVCGETRVPEPSVTYDIGLLVGASVPPWPGIVENFYERTLEALRAVTPRDGFVYAVSDYDAYRFWPHTADPQAPWVLGLPGATEWSAFDGSFVVPPDFSWVLHATQWLDEEGSPSEERITLSGQPLLDAFERYRPQLFSQVVMDAVRPTFSYEELKSREREMDAAMKIVLREAREYERRHEARRKKTRQ